MQTKKEGSQENLSLLETEKPSLQSGKLAGVLMYMMLFKSACGLGLFSYSYAFSKVGIVWGTILSLSMCYATTYGMYMLTKISNELENDGGTEQIGDYHYLSDLVVRKAKGENWAKWVSAVAMIATLINNIGVIISSYIEISSHVHDYLGLSTFWMKIIILAFYLAVTVYAIYPEQLSIFSFTSGIIVVIVSILMIFDNIGILASADSSQAINRRYEYFNIWNTGIFLGMSGFAYEACGTIFSLRVAMAKPHSMPVMIVEVFSGICVLYTVFSLSFYLAYGDGNIQTIAFLHYPENSKLFLYTMGVVFCIFLLLFMPMFNITNSDLFEHVPLIRKWIYDPISGQRNRVKLTIFRLILFSLSSLPALLTDKIELVINVCGSLAIPFISFYIPLLLRFMNEKNHGRSLSWQAKIHDLVILVFGTATMVLGLTYSFKQINE